MATFQDLQNDVEANIIDLPARVLAAVPTLVNQAIRKLQRAHNFKVMEATLSYTTTEDSSVLSAAVPATFKDFRGQPYSVPYGTANDGGQVQNIRVTTLEDARKEYGDAQGPPRFLVDMGIDASTYLRTFHLYPQPDGLALYPDGEYRIVIPYYAYTALLVSDGDTNWFVDNAYDYIVKDATAMGMMKNWDYEGGQVWATLAKGEMDQLVIRDKRERISGTATLRINMNAR